MESTSPHPLTQLLNFLDHNPGIDKVGFWSAVLTEGEVLEIHDLMSLSYGITSPQLSLAGEAVDICFYGQRGVERDYEKVLPREYVELLSRIFDKLRPTTRERLGQNIIDVLDIVSQDIHVTGITTKAPVTH